MHLIRKMTMDLQEGAEGLAGHPARRKLRPGGTSRAGADQSIWAACLNVFTLLSRVSQTAFSMQEVCDTQGEWLTATSWLDSSMGTPVLVFSAADVEAVAQVWSHARGLSKVQHCVAQTSTEPGCGSISQFNSSPMLWPPFLIGLPPSWECQPRQKKHDRTRRKRK